MIESVVGLGVNKIFVELNIYFSKNLIVNENALLVIIVIS